MNTEITSLKKSNKMQQCIKISLFHIYIKLSIFRRHTAHHQEHKTALATSGFSYVEGCWTCSCWTTYEKPEAARAVLGSW
jgi:hypothetical protein